jgi:hypothetical protein
VGGDDERDLACCEGGAETGRDEEVRVDHLGTERAGGAARAAGELEVTPLAACAGGEHGALDLVATVGQGAFDLLHEGAEGGCIGAGVHL